MNATTRINILSITATTTNNNNNCNDTTQIMKNNEVNEGVNNTTTIMNSDNDYKNEDNSLIINDFNRNILILMRSGCKRIMPMNDEMNQRKMNRISTMNDNRNNDEDDDKKNTVEDDDIENEVSNSQNNVLHHEKQDVITNQSVLHRSLAECLKRLCKEMENNSSNNNNSTSIMTLNEVNTIHKSVRCNYSPPSSSILEIPPTLLPVEALDLSMSSGTILNENVSSDLLKNGTKIFMQSLSPSSSSSTPSLSSFSSNTVPQHHPQHQQYTIHFTNTNQNDLLMNTHNHTTPNSISYPYHQHHQQSVYYDPLRIRNDVVTTTTIADNVTVVIPKMDSLLSNNLLLNTTVPNTTSNIQSNDNVTSNPLLFPGLPSTLFNLPSYLTYTNTIIPSKTTNTHQFIKESDYTESKELFSKLSNVINLHSNESYYNHVSFNDNEFYDTTTIMNKLLKSNNLINNNHNSNDQFNEAKNEEISTCTSVDETLIKEFDSELSLKPIDSCDTEQLDMKTASLWLTESDMHSIPNLVESIKKYHSNDECGFDMCRSSKIKEHYHCGICNKILLRREEMIRHAKWHRKREESMQYGFMRYSPYDDCTIASCPHNGRQTHYHCMQSNCDKVYVSTSDVQMHANYHRKDAVIIQEGFQRFRATENCGITKCPFFKEHTTHFHCRRNNCQFTFKNKADMEKHKIHHQKNDRFAQDGFRRYIKCENCDFPDCQYSGVINHIHCIRPGCDYVIHSSSQIISHKRKHDRRFTSISPRYMSMVCRDDLTQTTFSSSNQNNTDEDDDTLDTNKNKIDKNSLYTVFTRSDTNETDEHIVKQLFINEPLLPQTKLSNTFYSNSKSDTNSITNSFTINDFLNEVSKLVNLCICRRQTWEKLSYSSSSSSSSSTSSTSSPSSIDSDSDYKQIKTNHKHSLLSIKIDEILKAIHQSYDQHTNECFWPKCYSYINKNNENLNNYCITSKYWCKYWLIHLWEACITFYAYIECNDLLNCSIQSTTTTTTTTTTNNNNNNNNNNNSNTHNNKHIHCYFWPKCHFIISLNQLNFHSLYEHLLLHNNYFITQLINLLINHNQLINIHNNLINNNNHNHNDHILNTSYNLTINSKRRGRPPKYAKHIHVPHINLPEIFTIDNDYTIDLTYSMFFNQSIIDQHVIINNSIHHHHNKTIINNNNNNDQLKHIQYGVKLFLTNELCPDIKCPYYTTHEEHYHCIKPRCYMATNRLDLMNIHRREFHQQIIIDKNFEYYDISIDCRRPICHNNKINKHFHCIYPNCEYTFIRAGTMQQHAKKHKENLKSINKIKYNNNDNMIITQTTLQRNNLSDICTSSSAGAATAAAEVAEEAISSSTITTTTTTVSSKAINTDMNVINSDRYNEFKYYVQSIPSFLPLGIHSEHIPILLPNTHKENLQNLSISTITNNNIIKKECIQNSSLPGFLPIWASAIATVDVNDPVKKESTNLLSNITNECISDISLPFNQLTEVCIPSESQLPVSTGQNGVQV